MIKAYLISSQVPWSQRIAEENMHITPLPYSFSSFSFLPFPPFPISSFGVTTSSVHRPLAHPWWSSKDHMFFGGVEAGPDTPVCTQLLVLSSAFALISNLRNSLPRKYHSFSFLPSLKKTGQDKHQPRKKMSFQVSLGHRAAQFSCFSI